jgi:hypothetical protein
MVASAIAICCESYSRPWSSAAWQKGWSRGAAFAVDASLIAPDADKQRSAAGSPSERLGFDVRTVMSGRAFIALESPVGGVDRMFGHPFCDADLALDHAALKGDVAF